MNKRVMNLSLVACVLVAFGCGGGGGGGGGAAPSSAPPPATPPATGGGSGGGTPVSPDPGEDLIRGRITGFGSVYIDGVRFVTDDASFSKDDEPASQSDLAIGMIVEMRGDISSGTASSVDFEEDIKGPVDSVGADQLVVMGQTVTIAADTVFDDNLSLAALNVGDIVEVSGLRGANDSLEASFIEAKPAGSVNAYKVIGQVRDLDTTAQTFRIGGLSISYNGARLDDGVSLENGRIVEVKDESLGYNPGDMTLLATKVEPAGLGRTSTPDSASGGDDSSSNDDSPATGRLQVEGLISEIISGGQFSLGGVIVNHSSSTLFVYGDATALSIGTKVQVEGVSAADGSITASKIKFSRNSARIEGVVENVNMDTGEISILGVQIDASGAARLEDNRDDVEPFTINDILIGDFLEVRGNSVDNVITAQEIERDDTDDTRLRGPAADVDAANRTLSILGVAIVTSSSTQFEGLNDEVLTAQAFFDALASGQTLVDAQWNGAVTDSSVAVRELSLED